MWCLQMSETFLSRTKNSKQTNEYELSGLSYNIYKVLHLKLAENICKWSKHTVFGVIKLLSEGKI